MLEESRSRIPVALLVSSVMDCFFDLGTASKEYQSVWSNEFQIFCLEVEYHVFQVEKGVWSLSHCKEYLIWKAKQDQF